MVDLAQAFSEVKSLPDHILQKELSSPSGAIPGWLALGEIHERKRIRATTGGGDPNKRPSMAEEYAGSIQPIYAGAGMAQPAQPPQAMPPQGNSPLPGGIAGIPPPPPAGIASMPQAQQGYSDGGIVGLARGGVVEYGKYKGRGVDPRLRQILERAATYYNPYEVRLISGEREGDPRFHGKGMATDVQLYDPETGQALENYQSGQNFSQYQQYANAARRAQMEMYPELADQFRWGGYFSGGKGKYGALDLMHFDVGGNPNLGMAGGSWETGLTPEQAQLYGITQNVGYGGQQVASADGLQNYQRALLDTIAGPESAGKYNVIYGGQTFDDYSKHPGIAVPIASGPNVGQTSSAAGRYQFIAPTWNDISSRYKLADFSPQNQDIGAMRLAEENYARVTGKSLNEALQSGDPEQIAGVGKALSGTWTSLPGGIEQGIGADRFVTAYNTALGGQSANTQVAETAADVGTKMAATEGATGSDPMMQYFMMQQLLGGQQQPAAPAQAAQAPGRPVDPRQFMQDPNFMRRRGYGIA